MKTWLSGVRGTGLMILTWTVGWGFGFGGLIELFIDPRGEIVDIWFTVMAIPGFVGGILFSALLRIAEGPRSHAEVSLARGATWGVVTGLGLGVLAIAAGAARGMSLTAVAMIGITSGLGAVAAIGSIVFFRLLARGQTPAVTGPEA